MPDEAIEEYLPFPASFLEPTREFFAIRVKGDSMKNAGIYEGDIALLERIKNPLEEVQKGEIVAVSIDGEVTLKRFFKERKKILLKPENPKYKPISVPISDQHFHEVQILGKLIGTFRKYR